MSENTSIQSIRLRIHQISGEVSNNCPILVRPIWVSHEVKYEVFILLIKN